MDTWRVILNNSARGRKNTIHKQLWSIGQITEKIRSVLVQVVVHVAFSTYMISFTLHRSPSGSKSSAFPEGKLSFRVTEV